MIPNFFSVTFNVDLVSLLALLILCIRLDIPRIERMFQPPAIVDILKTAVLLPEKLVADLVKDKKGKHLFS